MITPRQYFGNFWEHEDATPGRKDNAEQMLNRVARLEAMALEDGIVFPDNPATGNGVSGQTFGGFRPQSCPQGKPNSSHKEGQGVDRYDPDDLIDDWCMANAGPGGKLALCGIYIEHPLSTRGWSHWTTRAPPSGHRVFYP